MAYAQDIRATEGTLSLALRNISERVARYRVYRNTLRELGELTNRDLADLGIHRSSIRAIAYEAAYGA